MEQKYAIRVQVIAVSDDDGSNAANITASQFAGQLTTVNQIFSSAAVEFVFDSAADFTKINNTLLNREFTPLDPPNVGGDKWDHEPLIDAQSHHQAREALARLFPGKLAIIYRNRKKIAKEKNQAGNETGLWIVATKGGGASSSNAFFVDMSTVSGAKDLAHEIGHYLQLPHTFEEANTIADAAGKIKKYVEDGHSENDGLNALDGDRNVVLDTPADCSITIFKNSGLDECGNVGTLSIPVTFTDNSSKMYVLAPDRSLVMSYFKGCAGDKTISPQQARRVRDAIELRVRHDLVSYKPSPSYSISRRATGTAGEISAFDVALVRFGRIVTAVRDGTGDLRVIAWDIQKSGNEIVRRGSADAGKVSAVALCSLGMNMVATAVRDGGHELTVILWRVEENGVVTRLQSAPMAGQITDVACCIARYTLNSNSFVTAVRTVSGALKLDAWDVFADGSIKHTTSADAGTINIPQQGLPIPRIAMSNIGAQSVATYVRDASGGLKAILWKYDGASLMRLGSSDLEESPVGAISACGLARDRAMAAVQDADKRLKLVAYRFPGDGRHIEQSGMATARIPKSIHDVSVCRMGTEMVATAVRDGANHLSVILWQVTASGEQVRHLTSAGTDETFHELAMCYTGRKQFATALRDDQSRLKLIVWRLAGPLSAGPATGIEKDGFEALFEDTLRPLDPGNGLAASLVTTGEECDAVDH